MKIKPFFREFFGGENIINHFIALVGLGCLLIWYFETRDIFHLTQHGISTKATVDRVDETVSATSGSGDIYYHFKYFSYDTIRYDDGTFFSVPKMHWGRLIHLQGKMLEEGDTIQILYDPNNFDKYIFDLTLMQHLSKVRVWGLLLMALAMLLYPELVVFWKFKGSKSA